MKKTGKRQMVQSTMDGFYLLHNISTLPHLLPAPDCWLWHWKLSLGIDK